MTDKTMREMKQVNNEKKKHIINTYKFRAFGSKLFIYLFCLLISLSIIGDFLNFLNLLNFRICLGLEKAHSLFLSRILSRAPPDWLGNMSLLLRIWILKACRIWMMYRWAFYLSALDFVLSRIFHWCLGGTLLGALSPFFLCDLN